MARVFAPCETVTATFHARATLNVTAFEWTIVSTCGFPPRTCYEYRNNNVSLSTGQTCSSPPGQTTFCSYAVRIGTVVTATKSNTDSNWSGCDFVSPAGVCTVTLTGNRSIRG